MSGNNRVAHHPNSKKLSQESIIKLSEMVLGGASRYSLIKEVFYYEDGSTVKMQKGSSLYAIWKKYGIKDQIELFKLTTKE